MRDDPSDKGRTVLIAERDQHVRELQRFFLAQVELDAEFVDDGDAALERARIIQPSLIITEVLLPKLDGLTLCRRLRDDPRTHDIPIVVFSILAAAARAAEAGANAFLRKPLVESTFLATIQNAIAAQSPARMEQQ